MKQKIPNGVVVAAIVIVVVGVVYFGWRVMTGISGTDMTQENIKRFQAIRANAAGNKFATPQDAARAGAPMGSATMGATRGSTAPTGSAPMGATSGGAAGGSQ